MNTLKIGDLIQFRDNIGIITGEIDKYYHHLQFRSYYVNWLIGERSKSGFNQVDYPDSVNKVKVLA